MNKYFSIFFIILYSSFLSAAELSDKALNQTAYALANYQMCKSLADEKQDDVMSLYYRDMLNDGFVESEKYGVSEREYIKHERDKAILTLNKINRTSMIQLCQNRFDIASRQYYETKLNASKNTKESQ